MAVKATHHIQLAINHIKHGSHSRWSAKEEKVLSDSSDSIAKFKEGIPNRWERVAQEVGGGKTPSACKKHAMEMKNRSADAARADT